MTTQKKTDADLKDNAPDGIALSPDEQAEARKEGAKDSVKEAAKDTHRYLTDGNLPGDPPVDRWPGRSDVQQYAPLLSLGVEDFEARVKANADDAVPEDKCAGLLEMERSGQNRTPYVKALMKRLGVKSPYEVTSAGPDYTNDVQPVTKL